jgi:hypothetical protein
MKEVKELEIDVLKWRTGDFSQFKTGEGTTQLLNSSGYMCCLGFMCIQSGLDRKDLFGWGEPCELHKKVPNLNIFIPSDYDDNEGYYNNSRLSDAAININDNDKTSITEKMKKLTTLFAEHGITIKFINTETEEFKTILNEQEALLLSSSGS